MDNFTEEEQKNSKDYKYIFLDGKVKASQVDVIWKEYNKILEILMNRNYRDQFGVAE